VVSHLLLLPRFLPAAAQTGSDIRFVNPEALGPSRGYTYLVDANRPGRILYLAGQLGTDPSGKVVSADFREQATQAYENIRIALAAAGAKFEDVVKMTVYLTDIRAQLPIHREIRDKYVNKAAPPASTTIEISRLAREGASSKLTSLPCWPRGDRGSASGGEQAAASASISRPLGRLRPLRFGL